MAIAGFSGSQGSNWGQASALAVVAMAPVFALALLVQKHFVRGLTLGAEWQVAPSGVALFAEGLVGENLSWPASASMWRRSQRA